MFAYDYDDENNKLTYSKLTDQKNQNNRMDYQQNIYQFDSHNRLTKITRFNDLTENINNAAIINRAYDFDNQMIYSDDVDNNRTHMYYNNRRELVATESFEGSSTSYDLRIEQDYSYLTKATFLAETNYPETLCIMMIILPEKKVLMKMMLFLMNILITKGKFL